MKLFRFSADEINVRKCGHCNWETETFYWLADTKEEALLEIKDLLEEGFRPLCSNCMADLLAQENYDINRPKVKPERRNHAQ